MADEWPRNLLQAWAGIVRVHAFPAEISPWWLDRAALMESIAQAARALGWQAQTRNDDWDMQLDQADEHAWVRCAGAGLHLDQVGRDVIGDTWRVLDLTPTPPKGTRGLHLLVAIPFMADEGDGRVRSMVSRWRAVYPGMTWVDAPDPMPRNQADMVFPGLGLIARQVSEVI